MARISKNVLKSPVGFSSRVRNTKGRANEKCIPGLALSLVLLARRFSRVNKKVKGGICPKTK